MKMCKVSDAFYTDFDNISSLVVEPVREFNEAEHRMDEYLTVVGVTVQGVRLPVPLMAVLVDDPKKALLECEVFIQKFWKVN